MSETTLIECSYKKEHVHDEIECDCYREQLNYFDPNYVKNLVMVNFHYLGKYAFTHSYSYTTSIAQIKYDLANKLHLKEDDMQIMHWHVYCYDCQTIEFIPTECRGFMDFTIVNLSDKIPYSLENLVVPDIITVQVEIEEDDYQKSIVIITVEIEDRKIRKPFLGGYRNRHTQIEYHHAFTQTGPPDSLLHPRRKSTRDAQTNDQRHRRTLMTYSQSTQMNNEQIWTPTANDKILTAQPYETAEEREKRIALEAKVRTIQRYYRRWKLRKALKILHEEYEQRIRNERKEKTELETDIELQRKKEILDKVFPRTRADFSMLYAMVDRWKKAHIERISKLHTTASKLAEFYLLLNKEIEMLGVIERHRSRIKEEMRIVEEIRFFNLISDPIKWVGYKDLKIEMDTIETQIGRKFKQAYYTACDHSVSTDQRKQFLSNLIGQLKQHNCTVGNEIVALAQREIQLLEHGIVVKNNDLEYLHRRLQALIYKHYRMIDCNRRVTKRMLKLKEDEMQNNLHMCPRCEKLKLAKDYPLNHKNNRLRTCTICSFNDRVAEPWIDVAPYRFILRAIRRDEKKKRCTGSIAFIIQERDIYYLIERIWHAQSIVSECKDLEKLRFIRWHINAEWSPWNCILLTEKEAQSHTRIKDLEAVYDEEFRQIVLSKHMFARCVFANVLFLERSLRNLKEERENARYKPSPDELAFINYTKVCETNVPCMPCIQDVPCLQRIYREEDCKCIERFNRDSTEDDTDYLKLMDKVGYQVPKFFY